MSLEAACVKEEPECVVTDQASGKEEVETECVEKDSQDIAGSGEVDTDDEFEYEVMLEPECVLLPVEISHEEASPLRSFRDFAAKSSGKKAVPHKILPDPLQDTVEIRISTYACGNCGKAFQQEHNLNLHIKVCQGSIMRKNANSNIYKPSKNVYFCEICKKNIPKLTNFRVHQQIHSTERPYTCEICKKSFKQAGTLKVHMRTHTGEKPYSCQECEKQFSQLSTLIKHKFQHTGEKPYSCEVCQRKFTYLINLKTHRRTHTGEKPHACEMCNKRYSTTRELKIHKLIHSGQKPHVCVICNCGFRQLSTLKKHIEIHTPEKYPCEICNKEFALLSYLKRHKRTHIAL